MFDYNKKFMALGIEYNEKQFKPLLNRRIYDNKLFPPIKPIKGGFWGSSLHENCKYKSAWEEYIYIKLNPSLFEHRLKNKSTIFSIKDKSRVLTLKTLLDVYIQISMSGIESNLAVRLLKVGGNVPKNYEKHFYVDFEKLGQHYDVIYVTKEFVEQVDWTLRVFEERVLNNQEPLDDKITQDTIYI